MTTDADSSTARTPMPLAELLGIRILTETPDEVVCRMAITSDLLNQGMITHGGALFTLADTALGILTNPPASEAWVGTNFSLQLYRGAQVGDVIDARATREHRSRSVQFCRVTLQRRADAAVIGALATQLQRAPNRPVEAADTELHLVDSGSPLVVALRSARRREAVVDGEVGTPELVDGDTVVVAFAQGQPRGYAVLRAGPDATAVLDVWVHPVWRGLGVGRLLTASAPAVDT